jgi:hypothetical protein
LGRFRGGRGRRQPNANRLGKGRDSRYVAGINRAGSQAPHQYEKGKSREKVPHIYRFSDNGINNEGCHTRRTADLAPNLELNCWGYYALARQNPLITGLTEVAATIEENAVTNRADPFNSRIHT